METTSEIRLQDSIATQLITIVFSFYVIIALFVTLVHMVAEFINTKNAVVEELAIFQTTFEHALSTEVYNLDDHAIQSILRGIVKVPIIIGVKVKGASGKTIGVRGTILNEEGKVVLAREDGQQLSSDTGLFTEIIEHSFALEFETEDHTKIAVGHCIFYSSTNIILQKVQYGFIFILVNSIIKTIALWVIFLWVSRKILSIPLRRLTSATNLLNMDNLENVTFNANTRGRNELKILEETFNKMIHKLILSRQELIENERLKMELSTAHSFQELLLPKSDPQLEEIEIASFYKSANETGGDWYRFRNIPENQTLEVLIGDVTGHGVPAAIITGMVESLYQGMEETRLKNVLELNRIDLHQYHPTYFLELLNNVLYRILNGRYNMTISFSVIDLARKNMVYASAAHNACLIWRPSMFEVIQFAARRKRSILNLYGIGKRLGDGHGNIYGVITQSLQKDDVILWYTDGLIENTNKAGEMFGIKRLKKILRESDNLSAHDIRDRIIKQAEQHFDGFPSDDDITFIVGRVN